MDTLNFSRARDKTLVTYTQNIWMLAAMCNITTVTSHVSGPNNSIADLLSRWDSNPNNIQNLAQYISNPIWLDPHLERTLLNYSI